MRHAIILLATAGLASCATNDRSAVAPKKSSPTQPYGGTPQLIPGKIEAEHYDEGKPGEAYHDVDAKNHGADYRGVTQVDIEKRPDASNGYGIGWTKAGEWVVYTVLVRQSGTYTLEIPVASKKQGGTFRLEFDGKDVTGPITVPDTGSWQKLVVIKKPGVQLKAGLYTMKMVMATEGASTSIGDIDYVNFVKTR